MLLPRPVGFGAGGVCVGTATVQVGLVIESLIHVTAPFRARTRPLTVTPLLSVTDVRTKIVPTNVDPDPSVAELVTCQKTLQGEPPLMNETVLDDAVMKSEVAWKVWLRVPRTTQGAGHARQSGSAAADERAMSVPP